MYEELTNGITSSALLGILLYWLLNRLDNKLSQIYEESKKHNNHITDLIKEIKKINKK